MDSIKVTPRQLRDTARKVDNKAGEYYREYQKLLKEVDTLTSTNFVGEDGTAFKEKVHDFEDDFRKMKELMEDYADFLRQAAQNYETTRANNIAKIKSLQS